MTDREQLVREAFEETIVKPLGGRYDENLRAQDFAMFSLGYCAAESRLLSLLPKEGEVVVPVEDEPTCCGFCEYEESDGSLIEQCSKCKAIGKAMIEARGK